MADSLTVAVVDYDAGNTLSVTRALEKVGARVDLTSDPDRIGAADAVVLPGVGAFGDCMTKLADRAMDAACRDAFEAGKPFLGVCVGLAGALRGLRGVARGAGAWDPAWHGAEVRRGGPEGPAHGLERARRCGESHPVLENLDGEDFYFVHSYFPEPAQSRRPPREPRSTARPSAPPRAARTWPPCSSTRRRAAVPA